jgi:polysaccharide chain length determinant protein (PEP-CTERM system associated)
MTQREWTAEDYMTLLRRRWVLIVILGVVGAIISYGVSRLLPSRFESQSKILVQQPTVQIVAPITSENLNEQLVTMKQQVLSRSRLEPLIRQSGLYSEDINRVSMDSLVARLQNAISVTAIRPMGDNDQAAVLGFSIDVDWDNPRTAQEVCTAVTSMFIQENIRRREQNSQDTNQFLAQQLADAKAKLDEQGAKLAAFGARHIGFSPNAPQQNFEYLSGLYTALDSATQAITSAQMDKSLAQSTLAQQIAAKRASQTGKNPETFGEQLAALQTQLASLQARYTDSYPDVVKTKIEIEALKKKIVESEEQDKSLDLNGTGKGTMEPLQFIQLRAQIHADEQLISQKTDEEARLQQQIKIAQARVQATPEVEQEYEQLTRDHQTALDFYNDLLRKRDQSAMATDLERRQEGEQFTLLEPADLPSKPFFPNRPLFALGGFGGGLTLGFGLAFLMELRDTSLRSERDVESTLRLPVLAMIPAIDDLVAKKAVVGRLVVDSGGGARARA